ncbi:MAG: hypothetical protein ABIJ08_02440 [Nanoarchaeota archaeon]
MQEEFEKLKKKIKEKFEQTFEVDGGDIPVHERYVKDEDIRTLKKKKRL